MLDSIGPGGGYTTSKSFGPGGPVRDRVLAISAIILFLTSSFGWFPFLLLREPITRLNCSVNVQSRTCRSKYPCLGCILCWSEYKVFRPYEVRTNRPYKVRTNKLRHWSPRLNYKKIQTHKLGHVLGNRSVSLTTS
jgi:hypothetical protein